MGNLELYHGRLGKDAQIRETSAGELAELNLGCDFEEDGQKQVYWFKVKAWRPSAAIKALRSGDEVIVYSAPYKVETWKGREGDTRETLVLVAVKVEIMPSRHAEQPASETKPARPAQKPASRPSGGRPKPADDDMPF